jgi:hypothetical protein
MKHTHALGGEGGLRIPRRELTESALPGKSCSRLIATESIAQLRQISSRCLRRTQELNPQIGSTVVSSTSDRWQSGQAVLLATSANSDDRIKI